MRIPLIENAAVEYDDIHENFSTAALALITYFTRLQPLLDVRRDERPPTSAPPAFGVCCAIVDEWHRVFVGRRRSRARLSSLSA
jgi:hypothetical protein